MAIPESKLKTWTNLYDPATAQSAHTAVRSELDEHLRPEVLRGVRDFLQGSYRNKTSIYQDSDVDLVLCYEGVCSYDFSELTFNDQIRAQVQVPKNLTGYSFHHFRSEVVEALVKGFGADQVDLSGKKSIKVKGVPGERFHADVIPCIPYRRYTQWTGSLQTGFVPGIALWTTDTSRQVVNYPDQHITNGWAKNKAASEAYKPTVRMYKNIRNAAVAARLLEAGVARSYFVECLLSNVPAGQFTKGATDTFIQTCSWLASNTGSNFMCQNGEVRLFGDTPEQWSLDRAWAFIRGVLNMYTEGS